MSELLAPLRSRVPRPLKWAVRGFSYRMREAVRPTYPGAALPWLQGSFAQCGEDLIVKNLFGILGVEHPSYLDIGAYHPFQLSNTALLHATGSSGINVEADPDAFAAFTTYRPRDVNLNVGVGAKPGRATFYRMTAPALNTFSKETAEGTFAASGERYRIESTLSVEIRTVSQILADRGSCPDFLSLDVEGLDLSILETMPAWPGRPLVICVETLTYSGTGDGCKLPALGEFLAGEGYIPHADTWINTIFVLRDRFERSA
jgi:FkbM family methyltransferase